ncbi:BTAD domain-containing putative transcriptional regulator [Streptosporangium sp. 'caverna']|uniref:AfsR/SARP family transcriptional regulator n=1 Tax=Streptosporangium sp. 'caverna' TaxID=2202249 RepID=UPI000D7DE277|nr:BTAD domain-containing putative transcriptional regulator [Streptosporangium sp. 'caverna']AWS43162.1 AfsR family transcriptional regulator [Streptosporangium sp. 'caverna']
MELRLLGPVEVWSDGQQVPVGGAKPRALLAALLLETGRVVTVDKLIRVIWEDDPPPSARGVLQTYVASLRRAFADAGLPDIIISHRLGYLAQIVPDALDRDVVERLVAEGRQSVRDGEHKEAGEIFRTALGLWRGEALDGIGSVYLRAEAARLEELRLAITEEWAAANLAAGQDKQLIDELTKLVALHPTRERLRRDLMMALYRLGRQADALAVYQQGRQVLIEELGIEPGPELRQAQKSILRSDPALASPAKAAARMPRQLPSPLPDFTGRAEELAALLHCLTRPATTPICVISGQGGAGKSALALRTAHEIAHFYPDGQLHVELRGTTHVPASAEDVLGRLLRELEPPGVPLPLTLEERAGRYRTLLADRRKLIVLDDAASEAQVRPLLPGGQGCGVIVTSRNRLAGLDGAMFVDLGMLLPEAAIDLLIRIAGADRIAADLDAARHIVQQCGGLPLALRVAGARLASRRRWSVRRLADRLADEQHRLDELAAGDLEVRTSIALSYDMLSAAEKRMLRRLGLLGLPSFPIWVAAIVVGAGLREAERLLEQLVDASLVDEVGPDAAGQARYRLHDLIRLFAGERARAEEAAQELTAMVEKVLGGWLWLIERLSETVSTGAIPRRAALGQAHPVDDDVALLALADPQAWFRSEEESLIVAVELAAAMDLDQLAVELASTLSSVALEGSQYVFDDPFTAWHRTHEAALAAARRTDYVLGEATLLAGLGHLYYERDFYAESRQYLSQALSLFRAAADTRGEAATLAALGAACREQGYLAEALHFLGRAEQLWSEQAETEATAHVKRLAATVRLEQGDYVAAWTDFTAAMTLYQETGSRRGIGLTLRSMSLHHRAKGEHGKAEELCEQALKIFYELGDRLMVAYCARSLAKARLRLGRHDQARRPLEEALAVTRTLHDRWGEACTLRTIGELDLAEGRLYQAKDRLEESLRLWEALRIDLFRARTLRDLALVHEALGDDTTARATLAEALEVFRLHGSREYDELSL